MDHVREALIKAKAAVDRPVEAARAIPSMPPVGQNQSPDAALQAELKWTPLQVQLDPKRMKRKRIISFGMSDPSYVAFDLLRTRVRKTMGDNHWTSIAVTSPTPGCGKTMVALNLAFSLSRLADCRVVLVDLDLKRPSIARTLGVKSNGSMGQFLQGQIPEGDCFVQVNANLLVGLSNDNIRNSSELILTSRMDELRKFILSSLRADIVLFDLPPMRSSDDALAFLPKVDAALLVVAAGTTTVSEVDECEQIISRGEKLLGVVMNKSNNIEKYDYY